MRLSARVMLAFAVSGVLVAAPARAQHTITEPAPTALVEPDFGRSDVLHVSAAAGAILGTAALVSGFLLFDAYFANCVDCAYAAVTMYALSGALFVTTLVLGIAASVTHAEARAIRTARVSPSLWVGPSGAGVILMLRF